jgi:8-oxo-dGTP pyrophosphatase MutT (NUDIX family)
MLPQETASREFYEETGGHVALSSRTLRAAVGLENATTELFWLPFGKYYLFTHLLNHHRWTDLPEQFLNDSQRPTNTLGWLPWPAVLHATRGKAGCLTWQLGSQLQTAYPSFFLAQVLRCPELVNQLNIYQQQDDKT